MARYRLSGPAKADITSLLRTSELRFGADARKRYSTLLVASLRRIAADPYGLLTRDQGQIIEGLRSFHIRHGRRESTAAPVASPVHVLFFRSVSPGQIEVLRVLHERMDLAANMAPHIDR